MLQIVTDRTQSEQTDVLAQYLRDDRLHDSKTVDGSNLRKVLTGLAPQFIRIRDLVNDLYNEYDPRTTTDFIEEWEKVLGLPDECFTETTDLVERRQQIAARLAAINASTATDFENIALAYGVTATVLPAVDYSGLPATLPFVLIDSASAPFTFVVILDNSTTGANLPATLPFVLGPSKADNLLCFFEKIKPAHTEILPIFI